MPCCRLGAEYTGTELDQIQVKLEYPLFFHPELKHVCYNEFLNFSHVTTASGKKKVFGQLLCNGRTTSDNFSLFAVFFIRFQKRFPLNAFMIGEIRIFGCNHRPFQISRNTFIGHPLMLQLRFGIFFLQNRQLLPHKAG